MAAKPSLAEKYASRHGPKNRATISPLRTWRAPVSHNLQNTETHTILPSTITSVRPSLAEKYNQQRPQKQYDAPTPQINQDFQNYQELKNKNEQTVPGSFRSPIKTVLVDPYSPISVPPPQLYKSSTDYSATPPTWRQKDPANPHTQKVMKKTGPGKRVATLARRLTGMFRSHSAGSRDQKEPATEPDRESPYAGRNRPVNARNYNTVPSSSLAEFSRVKSSSFIRPISQEIRSEVDEVDLAIRERRHQQEQRRLAAEKKRLEAQLGAEQLVAQRLVEDYERRLYLQQRDHEAQLEQMRRDLEAEAESFLKTDAKSADLQSGPNSALYSENDALCLRQQQLQDELANLSMKLAEKEALLAARALETKPPASEKSHASLNSCDLDGTEADIFLRYEAYGRSRGHSLTDLRSAAARHEQSRPKSPVGGVVYDLKQTSLVVGASILLSTEDKSHALASLAQCQERLEKEPSRTHRRRMARIMRTRQFISEYDTCAERSHEEALSRYGRGRSEGLRRVFERVGATLAHRANRAARGVRRFDDQLVKTGYPEDLSSHADVMQYVELLKRKASAIAQHRELTEFLAALAVVATTLGEVIQKVSELESSEAIQKSGSKAGVRQSHDGEMDWLKDTSGGEEVSVA